MTRAALLALLAFTSACSPARLQAVELRSDTLSRQLLAHWPFDDATGAVAHDDSGSARDGTLSGGTWLPDGRFAGALQLADGQSVSVPRFPDATSSFTVSAWVRIAPGSQTTTGKWTTVVSTEASGGWEINVDHQNPELELHFGFWKGPNTGDYEGHSCPGFSYSTWMQIAGVVDAAMSTYTVYRDGIACFTTSTEHKILPGSATLTMGEWPATGRYLAGDVDDIAIWGRALEPAEVALLAQTNVPSALSSDE
jgi:Concanavalin A-like lectin/glucanases superfamily